MSGEWMARFDNVRESKTSGRLTVWLNPDHVEVVFLGESGDTGIYTSSKSMLVMPRGFGPDEVLAELDRARSFRAKPVEPVEPRPRPRVLHQRASMLTDEDRGMYTNSGVEGEILEVERLRVNGILTAVLLTVAPLSDPDSPVQVSFLPAEHVRLFKDLR